MNRFANRLISPITCLFLALILSGVGYAQTCSSGEDLDEANRSALNAAGKRFYDFITKGDSASMKASSIPSLAGNFAGIEGVVRDNQSRFAQATATERSPYLLKQTDAKSGGGGQEYLCGVFGAQGQTAHSAEFVIPGLAAGNYGIVIMDVASAKAPATVAFVLQQDEGAWKLGGLYVKDTLVAGHDGDWYASKAKEYKAKGANHAAYLYALEARELAAPVPFMTTQKTDALQDAVQTSRTADMPGDSPVDLSSGGKTYKLTTLFPVAVGSDLYVVAKYQYPDVSNSGQAFQDNMAVMRGLLVKYPDLKDAFTGIVARATETSGRDYGSMMAMKDIK